MSAIWNALSSHHFDRNSLLINLGGGVVRIWEDLQQAPIKEV